MVGELAEGARARGMRFGVYCSSGLDWTFGGTPIRSLADLAAAVPRTKSYAAYVDAQWRELIARYSPSILWGDAGSPAAEDLLSLFSDYYEAVPDGLINDRFGQADLEEPGSAARRLLRLVTRVFTARAARGPARTQAALPGDARRFSDGRILTGCPRTPGRRGSASGRSGTPLATPRRRRTSTCRPLPPSSGCCATSRRAAATFSSASGRAPTAR